MTGAELLPEGATLRPFRTLAATLCLLLVGCASSQQEATGPPATEPTPPTTAAPSPETTPTPVTLVCPPGYDNAGAEYSYNPAETTRAEALPINCGTAAPVTLTCPYGWEHAGLEFTYDPDEEERFDARNRHCGLSRDERMIDAVCRINRDFAGLEYSYDPLEMDASEASDIHCGTKAPITRSCSRWYLAAGLEFTYDPDDTSLMEAEELYCGRLRSILDSCELLDDTVQAQAKRGTITIIDNCYYMDVHVWQFDGAFGPCGFLGSFSRYQNRGFSTDRLAHFGYAPDPDFAWAVPLCPDLDEVFEGGNITVDAVYLGTWSYETIGGFIRTVPAFEILRVR